jgi:D-methionine transport system ATP-binding protein
MSVIQEICNKVAVLELGSMVERGSVEELFRSPQTEAAKRLVYSGTTCVESMTSGRKVRVTFEGNSSFEPIIGNIILECKTPVNILFADTRNVNGKAMGEMILQLPDSQEIAEKMIAYFKGKNLGVKELTEDD